jgi:DNA repair protein SbcC/Rad50
VRVLELSLRNFRVFEELDLELPARVIGIFGENGSGKSTLMESIAFACYGVDAARTKKNEIRTHGVLTDCSVAMAFEHGGQQYEVQRTIKGRGHTPEAELFAGDLSLASGTTDVDAEIRRLLHMDLHVFRSSVFAEQKQLDAFSDLRPGERKQMALRLLGIKPVEEARTAVRREAKAATESATQLAGALGDLAALEAELKDAKESAVERKKGAKAAAEALKAATSAAKQAASAFEEVDAQRQRAEKLTVQLRSQTEQRDAVLEQHEGLSRRIRQLAEAIGELPDLEAELDRLGDVGERLVAATRFADAAAKLAAAEADLETMPEVNVGSADTELASANEVFAAARSVSAQAEAERRLRASALTEANDRLARAADADPSQPCPTCGRPLGDDFAGYVKHCRAAVADAKRAASAAEKSAKAAASSLGKAEKAHEVASAGSSSAREAQARRTRLAERVDAGRLELDELARIFEGEVPDVDALRSQAADAKALSKRIAELGADRKHLASTEKDLGAVEERLEALGRELASLAEEAERIAFDAGRYELLRLALRDAGDALDVARDAERTASDGWKEADKRVSELTGALNQAKETESRVGELRSDARYLERVAMLFNGFRDHLVARVGPELSREAETLFRELTAHAYDDLRVDEETLSIQIADGDAYFPVERFSGSETDLANLALRVAISLQLSRMSGADVGMLVLDEVLASLDEERKDLMVQTLGTLGSRFHQLFVVTHAERVKDQFPASIEVRTIGRRRSTASLV